MSDEPGTYDDCVAPEMDLHDVLALQRNHWYVYVAVAPDGTVQVPLEI